MTVIADYLTQIGLNLLLACCCCTLICGSERMSEGESESGRSRDGEG